MPAVLVEAGFLNTDADNALFDERFGEIAEAIADGVLKTLREDGMLQQEQEDDRPTEKLYRVQTGAYRNRAYAEDLLYRLQGQNFPAYILLEDGLYKVQVGALPEELDGVFLTHEHVDHVKGLVTFAKKYQVPIYASTGTWSSLASAFSERDISDISCCLDSERPLPLISCR